MCASRSQEPDHPMGVSEEGVLVLPALEACDSVTPLTDHDRFSCFNQVLRKWAGEACVSSQIAFHSPGSPSLSTPFTGAHGQNSGLHELTWGMHYICISVTSN